MPNQPISVCRHCHRKIWFYEYEDVTEVIADIRRKRHWQWASAPMDGIGWFVCNPGSISLQGHEPDVFLGAVQTYINQEGGEQ